MLASAVQQSESALCKHTSPPSWASLLPHPHPAPLGCHRAPSGACCAMRSFLLAIYFTHRSVYMSMLFSQSVPPSPSPPLWPHVRSLHPCLYSCPANRFICTIFFNVLIYDICFSLSDLLHSVWQTQGPSTSPQMTQFCSFLWLSSIPLFVSMILGRF